MSMSPNILDRERDKFVDSPTRLNKTAIETLATSLSLFGPPSGTNAITTIFGSNFTTYEFRSSYPSGTILKSVKVYYQDSAKETLTGVEIL